MPHPIRQTSLPAAMRFDVPVASAVALGLIVSLALGLGACSRPATTLGDGPANSGAKQRATAARVDVAAKEFQALIKKTGGIVLDVRTPGEVARGRIAGASVINLRDKDFGKKISFMRKDKAILVYCAAGSRSARAADKLIAAGFPKVYNLSGGIMGWNRAGLPIERGAVAAEASAETYSIADFDKLLSRSEPILVDFHTPWCAPCKRMAPIVDKLGKELAGEAHVVRVDIGASEALASKYKISGVPVFAVFKSGKERWRHSGELSAEALKAQVAKAAAAE